MKNKVKIILYVFIILLMLLSFNTKVYAGNFTMEGIITSADNFLNQGDMGQTPVSEDSIKDTSNLIYNVLLTMGTIVAVIWGIIIALQFITGSVEEKAKVKETLIPYIVGCIIVFGAFGIWRLVLIALRPIE